MPGGGLDPPPMAWFRLLRGCSALPRRTEQRHDAGHKIGDEKAFLAEPFSSRSA
jgi:hypothetical protein